VHVRVNALADPGALTYDFFYVSNVKCSHFYARDTLLSIILIEIGSKHAKI